MRYRTITACLIYNTIKMEKDKHSLIREFLESNPDILEEYLKQNRELITPTKWSAASNATYFREKYALELQPVLDAMMDDRKNRIFRYSNYRSMQPSSLRMRIDQAWRYLSTFKDPEGKYKAFRKEVDIRRGENGIVVTIIEEGVIDPMKADLLSNSDLVKSGDWKDELDKFLGDAPEGDKLVLRNIDLHEDDRAYLETTLHGLDNVMYSYDEKRLTVLKLPPDEIRKLKDL